MTLDALKANRLAQESQLYIYSDGPKNPEDSRKIAAIRDYLKTIDGFKDISIVEREKNLGLANSVITGVSDVVNRHGKVIVMEDDIVTSPFFLDYMNKLLDLYENESKIFSVCGYNYPTQGGDKSRIMLIPEDYTYDIFFSPRASPWGWATWKDRWDQIDWGCKEYYMFMAEDGMRSEIRAWGSDRDELLYANIVQGQYDSWALRWDFNIFMRGGLCVHPIKSYVNNIGNDASGTHCSSNSKFFNETLSKKKDLRIPKKIFVDDRLRKEFLKIFNINCVEPA